MGSAAAHVWREGESLTEVPLTSGVCPLVDVMFYAWRWGRRVERLRFSPGACVHINQCAQLDVISSGGGCRCTTSFSVSQRRVQCIRDEFEVTFPQVQRHPWVVAGARFQHHEPSAFGHLQNCNLESLDPGWHSSSVWCRQDARKAHGSTVCSSSHRFP
jgi:hypothetical protein